MRHKTPQTSSIEKALAVLLAFTPDNCEMGTVALSRKLNFHPATVNRILQILCRKGFLQQNDQTRKFVLGHSAFLLGKAVVQSVKGKVLNIAVPYLEDLCEKVGETVVLELHSADNALLAYVAQGKRGFAIGHKVGDRVPGHTAAGFKAILAFSSVRTIEWFLKKKMPAFTENTITAPETLRRQLKEIRQQGVAFCREEMVMGVNAIGAPIFDREKRPVAAAVVVGLAARLKCDTEAPEVAALKKTASEIGAQLSSGLKWE